MCNAVDIAWANASLLVLMFCLAYKTDDPAEDTTSAPVDGTTSLSPSNMVVARLLFVSRLLFVVHGKKSTEKNTTNSVPSRQKDKEFNHKKVRQEKTDCKGKIKPAG